MSMDDPLGLTFCALGDAIRRGIVARLAHGPCSVSILAAPYKVSAPAISRHLSVLEHAGLIARWKTGRVHYCRLRAEPLQSAARWIEQHRSFWEGRLDALAAYLDEENGPWETAPQDQPGPPAPTGSSSTSGAGSPSLRPRSTGRGPSRPR